MSRRPLDQYDTAPFQVDALVDHLPDLRGAIWCPCVGDGSLMRRLRERRPDLTTWVTNDLDATKPADYHLDARRREAWDRMLAEHGRPDWVVENPPFSDELAIAQHALEYARLGVVFMARISFSEGTRDRGPWLSTHPRAKHIVLERYSFTANGKCDNTTTEWLVWAKVPIASPGVVTTFGYKPVAARQTRKIVLASAKDRVEVSA
jgi:hypothetical protein